jgi:hypothetical protein
MYAKPLLRIHAADNVALHPMGDSDGWPSPGADNVNDREGWSCSYSSVESIESASGESVLDDRASGAWRYLFGFSPPLCLLFVGLPLNVESSGCSPRKVCSRNSLHEGRLSAARPVSDGSVLMLFLEFMCVNDQERAASSQN